MKLAVNLIVVVVIIAIGLSVVVLSGNPSGHFLIGAAVGRFVSLMIGEL